MDTNIGRFKMASDELKNELKMNKDDLSNAMSFFMRSSMTFCMFVGLYDRNQHCIEN